MLVIGENPMNLSGNESSPSPKQNDMRISEMTKLSKMYMDEKKSIVSHWEKSNKDVPWNLLDEKRLLSLDNLHNRTHAGKNLFSSPKVFSDSWSPDTELLDDVLLHYGIWDKLAKKSLRIPDTLRQICHKDWLKEATNLVIPQEGVLWIHVQSQKFLEVVAQHFKIHEVFIMLFLDMRPHSTFVSNSDGMFLSLCLVQISDEDCLMQKLFIFATHGLCITFEQEVCSPAGPPSSASGEVVHPLHQSVKRSLPKNFENTVFLHLSLSVPKAHKKLRTIGAPYLVYIILMESLTIQDPLLEFCSRCIYHYKTIVVEKRISEEKFIHRKVVC